MIFALVIIAAITVQPVFTNHNRVAGNTQTMTNISEWSTAVESAIDAKATSNALAAVAWSGAYGDLSGTPTIPEVPSGIVTTNENGDVSSLRNISAYSVFEGGYSSKTWKGGKIEFIEGAESWDELPEYIGYMTSTNIVIGHTPEGKLPTNEITPCMEIGGTTEGLGNCGKIVVGGTSGFIVNSRGYRMDLYGYEHLLFSIGPGGEEFYDGMFWNWRTNETDLISKNTSSINDLNAAFSALNLEALKSRGYSAFTVWAPATNYNIYGQAGYIKSNSERARNDFAEVYGDWILSEYTNGEFIVARGDSPIYSSKYERFVIRTTMDPTNMDVVVSWGDGEYTKISDCEWSEAKSNIVAKAKYNLLLVDHTYDDFGVYKVGIYGRDYTGFWQNTDEFREKYGTLPIADIYAILVCRCLDAENPIADHITNLAQGFRSCPKLLRVEGSYAYPLKNVSNASSLFANCKNLRYVNGISVNGYCNGMFNECNSLKHTDFKVNSSNTELNNVFDYCHSLTTPISSIIDSQMNRGATVNVNNMFRDCKSLPVNSSVPAKYLWENNEVNWTGTNKFVNGEVPNGIKNQIPTSWGGLNDTIEVKSYVPMGSFVYDIKTNGVSVVSNGVANINISGGGGGGGGFGVYPYAGDSYSTSISTSGSYDITTLSSWHNIIGGFSGLPSGFSGIIVRGVDGEEGSTGPEWVISIWNASGEEIDLTLNSISMTSLSCPCVMALWPNQGIRVYAPIYIDSNGKIYITRYERFD